MLPSLFTDHFGVFLETYLRSDIFKVIFKVRDPNFDKNSNKNIIIPSTEVKFWRGLGITEFF